MFITGKDNATFDPPPFLRMLDSGRRIVELKPNEAFFSQGRSGRFRLFPSGRPGKNLLSFRTKAKRPLSRFSRRRFPWEESLAAVPGLRLARPLRSTRAWRSELEEMR